MKAARAFRRLNKNNNNKTRGRRLEVSESVHINRETTF